MTHLISHLVPPSKWQEMLFNVANKTRSSKMPAGGCTGSARLRKDRAGIGAQFIVLAATDLALLNRRLAAPFHHNAILLLLAALFHGQASVRMVPVVALLLGFQVKVSPDANVTALP